jgi:hypothetical protein
VLGPIQHGVGQRAVAVEDPGSMIIGLTCGRYLCAWFVTHADGLEEHIRAGFVGGSIVPSSIVETGGLDGLDARADD